MTALSGATEHQAEVRGGRDRGQTRTQLGPSSSRRSFSVSLSIIPRCISERKFPRRYLSTLLMTHAAGIRIIHTSHGDRSVRATRMVSVPAPLQGSEHSHSCRTYRIRTTAEEEDQQMGHNRYPGWSPRYRWRRCRGPVRHENHQNRRLKPFVVWVRQQRWCCEYRRPFLLRDRHQQLPSAVVSLHGAPISI